MDFPGQISGQIFLEHAEKRPEVGFIGIQILRFAVPTWEKDWPLGLNDTSPTLWSEVGIFSGFS
jgi:hypothetical protein